MGVLEGFIILCSFTLTEVNKFVYFTLCYKKFTLLSGFIFFQLLIKRVILKHLKGTRGLRFPPFVDVSEPRPITSVCLDAAVGFLGLREQLGNNPAKIQSTAEIQSCNNIFRFKGCAPVCVFFQDPISVMAALLTFLHIDVNHTTICFICF